MDPDYTDLSGAVNLSVNGLGHLGESGKVFTPLISSSSGFLNSSSWSSTPSPAAPVDLVVGHPGLGESIRSTGVTSSIGELSHSSLQAVPNSTPVVSPPPPEKDVAEKSRISTQGLLYRKYTVHK
jgi:hypothetical protein